jgi:hypothetical protein
MNFRLAALALALVLTGCATTHEEPPEPPPPPIDPAAFSGPARPPAAVVDVSADLDAAVVWADAAPPNAPAQDAGSDAQVKPRVSHRH